MEEPRENGEEVATILVVEDEPEIADMYEMYLIGEYDVRVARNGAEALVEFGPEVDVVLLDRRMPGMSGDEVLEHLRDWSRDCYVAMVTAVDPDPELLDLPFDQYLTKPVSRDEMCETIEQLLLMDRYEQLLTEYNAVARKCATFAANDLATDGLQARREELLEEMQDVIASFEDEAVTDLFRDLHEFE